MGGYAEIALPLGIDRTFTYAIPERLEGRVVPGCEVLVPFRDRKLCGFVVSLPDRSSKRGLKEIIELASPHPFFDESMLRLTKWISEYYLCSWGEALRAALPTGVQRREHRTAKPKEGLSPDAVEGLPRLESRILKLLIRSGEMSWHKIRKTVGEKGIATALLRLARRGLIQIDRTIREPSTKPKTEEVFTLKSGVSSGQIEAIRKRSPRQADVLDHLLRVQEGVRRGELRKDLGVSGHTLNALKERGLVEISSREVFRSPLKGLPPQDTGDILLTGEQAKALQEIGKSLRSGEFRSFLLHGVTGSGKTEIYIRSIEEAISLGRRAIVLVPEISLAPQTLSALIPRFGGSVGVLHSHLSRGERYDVWRKAKAGEYKIVVGARSAVFAPLSELGLIVVDEEHETSYKQGKPDPRYSGRDVALVRAKWEKAVCILGSATPSLESFHNTHTGKSTLVHLSKRIDGRTLPPVSVVDMKGSRNEVFSQTLLTKMEERLRRGEQIILFLNRRGFSNFLLCRDCGLVFKCENCSVSLTHHRQEGVLLCHYCGFKTSPPDECPNCRGRRVTSRGVGTERVEKELKSIFPQLRVMRMDTDTTSRKGAHREIFYSFKGGEANILLGTQMVAKGFDIPKVTLVGVISADTALNLPDFRSAERTFQLLTQVAGRTGRGKLGGEVVIQTYCPDHYAIQLAQKQDYLGFYRTELKERQDLNYPPFSRLGRIVFSSPDEEEMETEAMKVASALRTERGVEVLGPAPTPVRRVKSNHRCQILLKSKNPPPIRRAIKKALRGRRSEKVRLTPTIDPVDMM